MAADVAPALLEAIQKDFARRVEKDAAIRRITLRVEDEKAALVEIHDYAQHLGEALSDSLLAVLTEDTLPDGRLYWNIADRTVRPMLEQNYRLTNDAAKTVQRYIDAAESIGLNPIDGDFPADRIRGIVDKAANAETLDGARNWLREPIVNCSEGFFDDYVQANATFRESAGMSPKLVRTVAGYCCDWCAELAGTYDYDDAPADIYRRHQYCRCIVTFVNGRKRQNVWSKKTWEESPATLEARRTVGLESGRGKDVTPEYFGTATPGKGKIEQEPGYAKGHHADEISTAKWIHDTFGGNLTLLTESAERDKKTPDFTWRSRLWELKTPSTKNAIDQAVRGALKQISENPGGIIIDARNSGVRESAIREIICHRLDRAKVGTLDIIIRVSDKQTTVIRYEK